MPNIVNIRIRCCSAKLRIEEFVNAPSAYNPGNLEVKITTTEDFLFGSDATFLDRDCHFGIDRKVIRQMVAKTPTWRMPNLDVEL